MTRRPRRVRELAELRLDLSLLLHPSTRTSVGAMAWRDRADDRVVHAQRACRLAHSLPGLFGRQAGTKMPVGRAQLVVVGGEIGRASCRERVVRRGVVRGY